MREPQFYTYAFTGYSFLWVIHVRRGLYSFMDVLKLMPQRTDGFCLYVFEWC
jgi:hypothetical protein